MDEAERRLLGARYVWMAAEEAYREESSRYVSSDWVGEVPPASVQALSDLREALQAAEEACLALLRGVSD